MQAMILAKLGTLEENPEPLTLAELPVPQPGAGEIRLRVAACGVCHTELDEIEGRAPPPRLPVVLGHQAVGRVDALGAGVAIPLEPETQEFPLEAANQALRELKARRIRGAKVLRIS